MTVAVYVLAALVGWCPTPPPRPKPTPKDPLAGIIGGIVGALVVDWALGFSGSLAAADFIAVMIGAFATGKVFQQLAIWIFPTKEPI